MKTGPGYAIPALILEESWASNRQKELKYIPPAILALVRTEIVEDN